MNATPTEELTFDDVEIDVPDAGSDFLTVPAGIYAARLVGFKHDDPKPDWKLKGEEGEDKFQYKWTFEITEGEYAGFKISDWTSRTWHERSTAHHHAAALLGVPTIPVGMGNSTRALASKTCQLWVIEKGTKKDPNALRNYIDKCVPTPQPRMRPQRPSQALSGSTEARSQPQGGTKDAGRVQLDGYPQDIPFEDGPVD